MNLYFHNMSVFIIQLDETKNQKCKLCDCGIMSVAATDAIHGSCFVLFKSGLFVAFLTWAIL